MSVSIRLSMCEIPKNSDDSQLQDGSKNLQLPTPLVFIGCLLTGPISLQNDSRHVVNTIVLCRKAA